MRINKIVCPKCQTSLTSKAGVEVGTSIACPKCKQKFSVAAPDDEVIDDDFDVVDDEEETPPKKPAKPIAKKKPVANDDEEEPPRQKKRPAPDDDEDDDDRPKAKKRSKVDDDDNRPRKKKKKRRKEEELSAYGKIKSNIWIRGSVLGVLLILLGVVVYVKLIKKSDDKTVIVVTETNEEDGVAHKQTPKVATPKLGPNQPKKIPAKVDDKKTAEEKKIDDDKKTAEEKKIDDDKKAAEEKKIDDDKKAAEEKKIDDDKKTAEEKKKGMVIGGQTATDLAKLQGNWKIDAVTFNGSATALDPSGFSGRWFKGLQSGVTDTNGIAQVTIDASKSPAEINFVIAANVMIRAIYRFVDENTLEICAAPLNGPRPQEFAAPKDSNYTLEVLKRKP